MNRHQIIDQRLMRLHQLIVDELDKRPDSVRQRGLDNLRRWKRRGVWCIWYDKWERGLQTLSIPELRHLILDVSEHGNGMRQCTPFTGVISEEQRRSVFREYESP